MTDEHKLHKDAARASNAKALLDNELLSEAFLTIENGYITGWRMTEPLDTPRREKFWLGVQVVGKVRDHLRKVIADGKLAQAEIDALAEKEKRRKLFGVV